MRVRVLLPSSAPARPVPTVSNPGLSLPPSQWVSLNSPNVILSSSPSESRPDMTWLPMLLGALAGLVMLGILHLIFR